MLRLSIVFAALVLSPALAFGQAWKDDVGYNQLLLEIGAGLENGSGVQAAFIEAPDGEGDYMPDLTSGEYTGKFFVEGSGVSGVSSHSNLVGRRFYGSATSMSTGLGSTVSNPVTGFDANDWIDNQLGFSSGADPLAQNFHVSNHSYIGNLSGTFTAADAENLLRRVDYAINLTEMTTVVGTNNNSANPLPAVLAQGYNSITVGLTNGDHASGLTTLYGAGRTKPEIVAPLGFTSYSTPVVSGAAAILHEAGAGTDAVKSESIKAMLLAGATKDEFGSWDRTTTRPLDEVFGAGELNIYNSYHILQGGEFDGVTSDPVTAVAENGWSYEDEITAGDDLFYEFEVSSGQVMDELSIAMTWDMIITDNDASPAVFDPTELLGDLNLTFYDSSSSFLGSTLDMSFSTVDNIEHLYLQNLAAGTYHLRVSSDTTRDYALAWRSSFSSVPEPSSTVFLGCLIGWAACRRRRRSTRLSHVPQ